MTLSATLLWGAGDWLAFAFAGAIILLALLVWGYARAGSSRWVKFVAGSLKAIAILLLLACLLEPMLSDTRARPGANLFVVLTDNSQSMTLRDRDQAQTRGEQVKTMFASPATWLTRLRQDFDVREFAFDTQLRTVERPTYLAFDGRSSNLTLAVDRVIARFKGRPLAGVILLSDGSATDTATMEKLLARKSELPPIYPILIGGEKSADDIGIGSVAISRTNFEDAPITLNAQASASGYAGKPATLQLLDETGKLVQEQKLTFDAAGKPVLARFQFRPEQAGVSFYKLRITGGNDASEATQANNTRVLAIDRGKGPYRVLYVSGRPNWEFKFLQRALLEDDQVQLAGLVRIAKREPKFNFLSRAGERTNPLFRGFDPPSSQPVEDYDQPVLVRIGLDDETELRGGFPRSADELYRYHAVIFDDVESEFFTQDQMQLIKDFVRQRGGGLLMLGGVESFKNGHFDRTPIGDLLPVYADQVPNAPDGAQYRFALTREGWLEPWVRLRGDETTERKRLDAMPAFATLNQIRGVKPGATVLATAAIEGAAPVPALVEQRFGQGRVGALLIGDLWRWGLRQPTDAPDDMAKAWRQTVRWLVSDVPGRVEASAKPLPAGDGADGSMVVAVDLRDPAFAPLDNASVTIKVTGPDGKAVDLTAEASSAQAGRYEATYVPRQTGAYRAQVKATAPDGSDAGQTQVGWTCDPAMEEFATLAANRELLSRLARDTGGQMVQPADLDSFIASLPTRKAQVTESFVRPLWHMPWVFLLAIVCLTAEWGLRRYRGLP